MSNRLPALIALVSLVLAFCTDAEPAGPNLLLITVDTTRADYIGCYGETDVRTPAIDALAAGGVRFEHNVAPSQCTNPSHASIMTGLYLARHGVYDNETPLSGAALTLAEVLRDRGYRTLAAVSARHLNPGNSNFAQGFDEYLECDHYSIPAGKRNEELLPRLARLAREGSFFAWVHYFDPHGDYAPPEPYDSMYEALDEHEPVRSKKHMESRVAKAQEIVDPDEIVPLYKGEISYLDAEIGRLLAVLDEEGVADDTLVVLVADHGESMAEHGIYFCHAGMYEQVLHTPLIMRHPGRIDAGLRVSARTSSTDLFPTVLDLLGIESPGRDLSGRSLRGALANPDEPIHEYVFSESVRGVIRAVYAGDDKYIKPYPTDWAMPRPALFDLAADPGELADRTQTEPGRAEELDDVLEAWLAEASAKVLPAVEGAEPDEATREALKALGYVD